MLATGEIRDIQRPKAIGSIERNAVALQHLVDELLDMSRIVAGKLRLDIQPISMADVVSAAVETVRPAADGKGIQLAADVEPDGDLAPGDPRRLQQVVWNLLSNAVKFTGSGGRIDVVCRRVNQHFELTVRDTGVGIDPQFVPFVFERFRQGQGGATRLHGGLGLGLSIVRDIVELHGGTVMAENNVPPPGAAFRVVLPVAAHASTYSAGAGWPARETPAGAPTSPKTAAR
jgi:signal transduction histidine kinase